MTSNSKYGVSDIKTKDGIAFGKELRDKEFLFDKNFLNLNHGGSSPLTTAAFILLDMSFNTSQAPLAHTHVPYATAFAPSKMLLRPGLMTLSSTNIHGT
jgi:hypothetical protein